MRKYVRRLRPWGLKAMRRRLAELVAAGEAAGEEAPIPAAAGEETPLEAAPAAPEAAPEVLWPAAGDKVAVGVEHLLHTLRVGETGVCEGLAPDDPLEVIVRLESGAVMAPSEDASLCLGACGRENEALQVLGQVPGEGEEGAPEAGRRDGSQG